MMFEYIGFAYFMIMYYFIFHAVYTAAHHRCPVCVCVHVLQLKHIILDVPGFVM